MSFTEFALAVFLGNTVTLCFVWGAVQFHRHDYKAPWTAYAAFAVPMLLVMLTIAVTEGLPPQFDALEPRQSVASGH